MIDRNARNKLAQSLRHLANGLITNDQFEDATRIETDDAVIDAIREQAWLLYSDLQEHKLSGSDATSECNRRIVARFILFLQSNFEYEWPRHPFSGVVGTTIRLLSFLLSLGIIPYYVNKKWKAAGDFDMWPFFRGIDYEQVLRKARFLRGRAA